MRVRVVLLRLLLHLLMSLRIAVSAVAHRGRLPLNVFTILLLPVLLMLLSAARVTATFCSLHHHVNSCSSTSSSKCRETRRRRRRRRRANVDARRRGCCGATARSAGYNRLAAARRGRTACVLSLSRGRLTCAGADRSIRFSCSYEQRGNRILLDRSLLNSATTAAIVRCSIARTRLVAAPSANATTSC